MLIRKARLKLHMMSEIVALLCAAAITQASATAQVVYDPAADFSATNNPNGVWQYGWTQTLGSLFNLDTSFQNGSGLDFWVGPVQNPNESFPYIAHNGTSSTINYLGFLPYPAGQLGLHPGPDGQYAAIRFTAPQATEIILAGSYFKIGNFAPTTDVHILANGVSIWGGALGSVNIAPFALQQLVAAGDTIDFVVGFGGNGYFGDSTGLAATITPIPEPGALTLTGLVFAAAISRRMRSFRTATSCIS